MLSLCDYARKWSFIKIQRLGFELKGIKVAKLATLEARSIETIAVKTT